MVDPEPEAERLHPAGQKRQAHQRQRALEDPDDYLYYSDDPVSLKRATTREMNASKRLKELERWLATTADRLEMQETGVTRPYPPELDSEPYSKGFKVLALHSFDGTKLASQH